jgi:hypothetical protein
VSILTEEVLRLVCALAARVCHLHLESVERRYISEPTHTGSAQTQS